MYVNAFWDDFCSSKIDPTAENDLKDFFFLLFWVKIGSRKQAYFYST